jgi:hypothetical protein
MPRMNRRRSQHPHSHNFLLFWHMKQARLILVLLNLCTAVLQWRCVKDVKTL